MRLAADAAGCGAARRGGGPGVAEGRLAHYKIPRYVVVVEEFPMTATGKIRKVEMREESLRLLDLT